MGRRIKKDDFEKALRAHKEAADEMKSGQREAAKLVNAPLAPNTKKAQSCYKTTIY